MKIIHYCKQGLPIYYDEEKNSIVYKDNVVNYDKILSAINNEFDIVELQEDLKLKKTPDVYIFGCLQLEKETCNTLIKTICKLLKQSTNVGNKKKSNN